MVPRSKELMTISELTELDKAELLAALKVRLSADVGDFQRNPSFNQFARLLDTMTAYQHINDVVERGIRRL